MEPWAKVIAQRSRRRRAPRAIATAARRTPAPKGEALSLPGSALHAPVFFRQTADHGNCIQRHGFKRLLAPAEFGSDERGISRGLAGVALERLHQFLVAKRRDVVLRVVALRHKPGRRRQRRNSGIRGIALGGHPLLQFFLIR